MRTDLSVVEKASAESAYREIEAEASRLGYGAFVRYKEGLASRRARLEDNLACYARLVADSCPDWERDKLEMAAAAVRGGIAALERAERELEYEGGQHG